MKVHDLKLLSCYFEDVETGVKNFEIRKNDRDFHVGDRVNLCEWDGSSYTGRLLVRKIIYITNFPDGLKEGYVVLGLGEAKEKQAIFMAVCQVIRSKFVPEGIIIVGTGENGAWNNSKLFELGRKNENGKRYN